MNLKLEMESIGQRAKIAADWIAQASATQKNQALTAMAEAIANNQAMILDANRQDVEQAKKQQYPEAFIDRLILDPKRIDGMVSAIHAISDLPDPVNRILSEWQVPSGLIIKRVSMPLGVIGVIYESRPNVTADAAALCFKAGNAVILRGGSECAHSNQAIIASLHQGLRNVGMTIDIIQYVPTQDREAVGVLLQMSDYIDVIIPRGGASLVKRVIAESRIPLFQHLQGLCHTYIHQAADKSMAIDIVVNAKMRRTGICGATETLLIDEAVAATILPDLIDVLIKKGCEIRGCDKTKEIDSRVKLASQSDWETEYLDAILSIKIVKNLDEAVAHIRQYGSSHTESIVTNDNESAAKFMNQMRSAIVMHNASTQFADGGEFGMGAEIGISTGKLHARGPVGVEQLTTFHYYVTGNGQTRP
jgi:glutamate-5-semialdehyde dehydrogenase